MIKLVSYEARELVNLLKAYSKIIPNPVVEFRRGGMSIIGMDENQVALGIIHFSVDHLDEFGGYEVEREVGIVLDLRFIRDIPVYSEDVLELEVVDESPQRCLSTYCKMNLRISGKSEREYTQEVLVFNNIGKVGDEGIIKIPNIWYENGAVGEYQLFADSVRAFRGVSKTVRIRIEDEKLILEGSGERDNLKVEMESSSEMSVWNNEERAVATFDLGYLLKILKVFDAYFIYEIHIGLNTDCPLELGGPFMRGSGSITFYLAPLCRGEKH